MGELVCTPYERSDHLEYHTSVVMSLPILLQYHMSVVLPLPILLQYHTSVVLPLPILLQSYLGVIRYKLPLGVDRQLG